MEEAEYFSCYFCKMDEAQLACNSDYMQQRPLQICERHIT